MTIPISENIKIWKEVSPFELSWDEGTLEAYDSKRTLAQMGFNKERIAIKDR